MSIDAIDFIPGATKIAELTATEAAPAGTDFGAWLESQLQAMDTKISASEGALAALATGETSNIHQVLMSLEEAKLQFSLIVQVRNKVLAAYQDIMRMQI